MSTICFSSFLRLCAGVAAAAVFLSQPLRSASETELKDAAGKPIIRYVVEAPENIAPAGTSDPAKQLGLILCFPEHDRPTGDEILPVREALKRLGLSDQYVLLAGHPQGRKFGAADHEPIAKLIAWAKKTYPINPRRVYMYGKGEGGKISGEYAMMNPNVVTAGITYSWGWWKMPSELTEAIDPLKSAPEFYMVLGLRDLSHHLTTVRDTYARVNAKGYHVIYREFEDLGARTYHPPSNDDAIAWAARLRNKNLPLSAGEVKLLQRFKSGPLPAANAGGYYTDLALVGGASAGEVVERLLRSTNANVRAAAAETCLHAIFSENAMTALAQRLTDPSARVRRAAVRALALNANWRSEAAQTGLIDFALDAAKAVDPADRAGAVDAIIQAARLQINGVRQDPGLFKALVTLLEDKNEELRTMAANTLAPIRDAEFRGDLGRPERKTPEGGWQNWLAEVSAKAAGYRKDYDVCGAQSNQEPVNLFCTGGGYLLGKNLMTGQPMRRDPALAFKNTLKAAEQGYAPAGNAVALMYANGKGTEQDYASAAAWWVKAAEAGHLQAASHAAMVYRGGPGIPSNAALSAKWAKFVQEKQVKGSRVESSAAGR
jgi:TPR repeat protein